MSTNIIVTVGGTRRKLEVPITDANNQAVVLHATLSNHRLQGRSTDLTGVTIDMIASAVDTAQGLLTFNGIAGLVTQAQLTGVNMNSATFRCEVKFTDNAGLVDFTLPFYIQFLEDPLQLP